MSERRRRRGSRRRARPPTGARISSHGRQRVLALARVEVDATSSSPAAELGVAVRRVRERGLEAAHPRLAQPVDRQVVRVQRHRQEAAVRGVADDQQLVGLLLAVERALEAAHPAHPAADERSAPASPAARTSGSARSAPVVIRLITSSGPGRSRRARSSTRRGADSGQHRWVLSSGVRAELAEEARQVGGVLGRSDRRRAAAAGRPRRGSASASAAGSARPR